MIWTPLNNVVVGAPNEAAVPVVGKQLSAVVPLELLDDELAEELTELMLLEALEVVDEELAELVLVEELDELEITDEELDELMLLEALEVVDEELLDELLLFDALELDKAVVASGAEAPPLHAVRNKQRLARVLEKL
jgi:hypothetical protein